MKGENLTEIMCKRELSLGKGVLLEFQLRKMHSWIERRGYVLRYGVVVYLLFLTSLQLLDTHQVYGSSSNSFFKQVFVCILK